MPAKIINVRIEGSDFWKDKRNVYADFSDGKRGVYIGAFNTKHHVAVSSIDLLGLSRKQAKQIIKDRFEVGLI